MRFLPLVCLYLFLHKEPGDISEILALQRSLPVVYKKRNAVFAGRQKSAYQTITGVISASGFPWASKKRRLPTFGRIFSLKAARASSAVS